MFFAPYGCSWAKHSICKSLLVQSQIPGLVHTHPSIFGGKLFIDFQSLHTNIPVEDTIECIIKLVEECENVIPTANLILEILKVILKNSVMTLI